MSGPAKPRPPRASDPYGIGPVGSWIAPALAIVGLVLVAIVTLNLLQGEMPLGLGSGSGNGNGNGNGSGDGGPARTPAPSNVVVVPDEAAFQGSIVYAKAGNIWIQTDDKTRQLTQGGDDSMPSWSPDGQDIYYIHTVADEGKWGTIHGIESYALDVPQLMRIKADGSGKPERLATSKFKKGNLTYAYWIRQPVVQPNGGKIAVVSDAPNPDQGTVVLQLWDPATKKFRKVDVGVKGVLGHQDPEWRPDGQFLLYVRNGRDGSRGAPTIMRYNPAKGTVKEMTGPGYLQPSYSPDGKYIAATKTSAIGSDIVILDGSTGKEITRLTDDAKSWSPVWSPAGDGVAFLHIDGQTVDLRLAKLDGDAPNWTVADVIDLTVVSGLDADSGPDWFIPADQLPATPPPTIAPSAVPSASGSAPLTSQ
jgi:dipeptidyl aminopeptidase/acylaminoacyl peptidase